MGGFRIKKSEKQEGSARDEGKNRKQARDAESDHGGESAPDDPGADKEHGEEQDAEQEMQHKAGADFLSAIESGDPHSVYLAHRHMSRVHEMSDSAEGGGMDLGDSPNVGKRASFADAIRKMPLKSGV